MTEKTPRSKLKIVVILLAVLALPGVVAMVGPRIAYRIGDRYYDGAWGWYPDKAARWYGLAAAGWYCEKPYELGMDYTTGNESGTGVDYPLGMKLLKIAAGRGDRRAMIRLGHIYLRGQICFDYCDVPLNSDEAAHWFGKSAAAGDPESMACLGYVRADQGRDREAVACWLKAADAADDAYWADSTFCPFMELGKAYETGRGVSRNIPTAVTWYRKASAGGNPNANDALKRLGQSGQTHP